MKTIREILKATGITLIILLIVANNIEKGDVNALSMYFVVFMIPLILISILNGLWLNLIEEVSSKIKRIRFLSLIPVLILIFLTFMKNVQIPYYDGGIGFIGIVGGIGIGINNLIWNYHLKDIIR